MQHVNDSLTQFCSCSPQSAATKRRSMMTSMIIIRARPRTNSVYSVENSIWNTFVANTYERTDTIIASRTKNIRSTGLQASDSCMNAEFRWRSFTESVSVVQGVSDLQKTPSATHLLLSIKLHKNESSSEILVEIMVVKYVKWNSAKNIATLATEAWRPENQNVVLQSKGEIGRASCRERV